MLVCSRCKKDLNNEKPAHIIVVKPVTLPTDGHQDYSLCKECYNEYHQRLSMLEDKYILGKDIDPTINHPKLPLDTSKMDTHRILLESAKTKVDNGCDHSWYPVSCSNYDVEGCQGYICGYCGDLDCYCNIDHSKIIDDRKVGDMIFEIKRKGKFIKSLKHDHTSLEGKPKCHHEWYSLSMGVGGLVKGNAVICRNCYSIINKDKIKDGETFIDNTEMGDYVFNVLYRSTSTLSGINSSTIRVVSGITNSQTTDKLT